MGINITVDLGSVLVGAITAGVNATVIILVTHGLQRKT